MIGYPMRRVTVPVLVLALLALAACGEHYGPPSPPVAGERPTAEVFDGMDLSDALVIGVVHAPDGRPAPGARVYLDEAWSPLGPRFRRRKDNQHEADTSTDEAGRFVFPSSEWLREMMSDPGVEVWASKDDLVALPQIQLQSDSCPVTAPFLTLGPSIEPKLKLVDPEGKPVADAFVVICLSALMPAGIRDPELLYQLGAWSDAEGHAVFPRVPDRVDWKVALDVVPRDMPKHHDEDVSATSFRESRPLTVRLARGCTVSGRALLPDATPGRRVRVSARRGRWGCEPYPSHEHSVVSHKDGTFVLPGVPTTDAVLSFTELEPAGSPPRMEDPARAGALLTLTVEGEEGQVVELGTVRLHAPMSISGVVLDGTGRPATMGYVSAIADGPFPQSRIGPDGRFEIGGLEPGHHTLIATIHEEEGPSAFPHQGLQAMLAAVEAGARDVIIRVTGGGNLIVRFHPKGKPSERLEVLEPYLWSGADYLGGAAYECADLRIALDPGIRSDLRIEATGYKPKPLGRVEIHADRPTIVDLEIERSP